MRIYSQLRAASFALAAASGLAAQQRAACTSGPGAAFGIRSYQCANCAFTSGKGGFMAYTFFAEPVVIEVDGTGLVNVGDIVEAVNGSPITTTAGGAQFAYPPPGRNELTVRRGRDRRVLAATVPSLGTPCDRRSPDPAQIDSIMVRLDSLLVRIRGSSVPGAGRPGTDPLIIVDGVQTGGAQIKGLGDYIFGNNTSLTGGFGFAVACPNTCAAATANEGTTAYTYYTYSTIPPIVAVKPGSVAEKAGIKVGDVVVKVDGVSILEDAGARRLWSVHRKDSIHLTVLRDGKEIDYSLTMPAK